MSDTKKPLPDDVFEIESLNVDQLDVEELERRIELTVGMPMIPGDLGIWCDCNGHNPCSLCTDYSCTTACTDCAAFCGTDCTTLGTCSIDRPEIQV